LSPCPPCIYCDPLSLRCLDLPAWSFSLRDPELSSSPVVRCFPFCLPPVSKLQQALVAVPHPCPPPYLLYESLISGKAPSPEQISSPSFCFFGLENMMRCLSSLSPFHQMTSSLSRVLFSVLLCGRSFFKLSSSAMGSLKKIHFPLLLWLRCILPLFPDVAPASSPTKGPPHVTPGAPLPFFSFFSFSLYPIWNDSPHGYTTWPALVVELIVRP